MEPIQNVLNRIRWDPAFGGARFVIGYYDRTARSIVKVPYEHIAFAPGDHFSFQAAGGDGAFRSIPLHRVREVYRNGELIWHRQT